MIEIPQYSYYVTRDDSEGEFVGLCVEFPSLKFGDSSRVEALNGIKALARKVSLHMMAEEEELPTPVDSEGAALREAASMQHRPSPQVYTEANGQERHFLRLTTLECAVCKGATGGSRMGVLREVGHTLILECENSSCNGTLRVVRGSL